MVDRVLATNSCIRVGCDHLGDCSRLVLDLLDFQEVGDHMYHANDQLFFNFEIEPVPQLRPRVSSRGGYVRVYDPPKVKQFKSLLRSLASSQYSRPPLLGALCVSLIFYRPVQRSLSKTERSRRLSNQSKPVVKPDVDNYVKATLDGLTGVLWHDDSQIVKLVSEKRYGESGKIVISVKPV